MTKAKTPSKDMTLYVAVAEYDESGSDGLNICNVVPFKNSLKAAKFIAEDINDTVGDMAEALGFEPMDKLFVNQVIMNLKKGENHSWNTPEGTPSTIMWKVFCK